MGEKHSEMDSISIYAGADGAACKCFNLRLDLTKDWGQSLFIHRRSSIFFLFVIFNLVSDHISMFMSSFDGNINFWPDD